VATLSKDGKTVASDAEERTLFFGTQTVQLAFSGQKLRRHGLNGPFSGVVSLRDSNGASLESKTFTTAAYDAESFAALIQVAGPWIEEATDINRNKLFDFLRIAQPISTAEGGDYILTAKLSGRDSTKSVYSETRAALLKGANTVVWSFAGTTISAQGMDGPYQVEVTVRESTTGIERDRLRLPQLTKRYSHMKFDVAGAPGDVNGDGAVNQDDLAIVQAARGLPAEGPNDRRDLDGDGEITVLDMRKLVRLFTHPGGRK
jgi:hypothetical protein